MKSLIFKIFAVILSIVIFISVCIPFSELLPYRDFRLQMVWDDIYGSSNIDYIFVGSSHVYTGIDPFLIEELTGRKTVLISSGVQTLAETCYSIEEALKYQSPKAVFVDLYGLYKKFDRQDNFMNADCMRLSPTKIKLAKSHAFSEVPVIDVAFPLVREHSNWKEWDNIKHNYMMIKYPAENTRGYSPLDSVMPEETAEYFENLQYDDTEISLDPEDVKYLHKIEDLCKKNGCEARFFMVPWYKGFADKINYKSLTDAISSEIKFTDYTLSGGNIVGLDHTFFIEEKPSDNQHLNRTGAEIFTKYLVETQGM